jgi:serine protease Do
MVKTPSGLGSGFIINDKEGYIVTCYHVIEKERDITVIVFKKKGLEFENVVFKKVKIVAINPFFDLALLKLQEIGDIKLKKVYLGRLEEIKTGDVAFAIGNPHGYKRTVSEGIISTKAREREGKLYIQTTAPINPGNSGGPLFNDRGEVIGVTSWKIVGFFGGTEAMGFAINVEDIKEFLENREAFAFDKDNPNTGIKYFKPPRKSKKK